MRLCVASLSVVAILLGACGGAVPSTITDAASPAAAGLPIGGGGCHSTYDGTYLGHASYEFHYVDWLHPQEVMSEPETHDLDFTLVMRCSMVTGDQVTLSVTKASSTDPFFGALGLVDVQGTATLPKTPPTFTAVPSGSVSIVAPSIVAIFPSGAVFNLYYATVPSNDGRQIASDRAADGKNPPPWLLQGDGSYVFPRATATSLPKAGAGASVKVQAVGKYHGWSMTNAGE